MTITNILSVPSPGQPIPVSGGVVAENSAPDVFTALFEALSLRPQDEQGSDARVETLIPDPASAEYLNVPLAVGQTSQVALPTIALTPEAGDGPDTANMPILVDTDAPPPRSAQTPGMAGDAMGFDATSRPTRDRKTTETAGPRRLTETSIKGPLPAASVADQPDASGVLNGITPRKDDPQFTLTRIDEPAPARNSTGERHQTGKQIVEAQLGQRSGSERLDPAPAQPEAPRKVNPNEWHGNATVKSSAQPTNLGDRAEASDQTSYRSPEGTTKATPITAEARNQPSEQIPEQYSAVGAGQPTDRDHSDTKLESTLRQKVQTPIVHQSAPPMTALGAHCGSVDAVANLVSTPAASPGKDAPLPASDNIPPDTPHRASSAPAPMTEQSSQSATSGHATDRIPNATVTVAQPDTGGFDIKAQPTEARPTPSVVQLDAKVTTSAQSAAIGHQTVAAIMPPATHADAAQSPAPDRGQKPSIFYERQPVSAQGAIQNPAQDIVPATPFAVTATAPGQAIWGVSVSGGVTPGPTAKPDSGLGTPAATRPDQTARPMPVATKDTMAELPEELLPRLDTPHANNMATRSAPIGATHAAPLTNAPTIAAQISSEVSIHGTSGRIEIALHPEELGRIELQFTPRDDTLIVHLSAQREDTALLLRRHLAELGVELRNAGYTDVAFSFAGAGEDSAERGDGQRPAHSHGTAQDPTDIDEHRQPASSPIQPTERLNLRL